MKLYNISDISSRSIVQIVLEGLQKGKYEYKSKFENSRHFGCPKGLDKKSISLKRLTILEIS